MSLQLIDNMKETNYECNNGSCIDSCSRIGTQTAVLENLTETKPLHQEFLKSDPLKCSKEKLEKRRHTNKSAHVASSVEPSVEPLLYEYIIFALPRKISRFCGFLQLFKGLLARLLRQGRELRVALL